MDIPIHKEIYALYEGSPHDLELSLQWFLGYVEPAYARKVQNTFIQVSETDSVLVDLSEDVLHDVSLNKSEKADLASAVNLFLLAAYLLGGSE